MEKHVAEGVWQQGMDITIRQLTAERDALLLEKAELIAVLREVDDALPKVYEDDLPLPDNSPRKRMKDVIAKHRGQK